MTSSSYPPVRLLVCPPEYFAIDYEINPWMDRTNVVDPSRARAQWHGLMAVLASVGAELLSMRPVPTLPDLVFTANAGVVDGRRVVTSRFRYVERQREEAFYEAWFREAGYEILTLDPDIHFEGEGDLLGFADLWFGGYRQRTDIQAYPAISALFAREIVPLELVDTRFYHLDTCFCPLSGGELLYFPSAFDVEGQAAIEARIPESHRIVVSEWEAQRFACNAVCVGRNIVMPEGCPDAAAALEVRGYRVHACALDEFLKSGGSAKCLTLALG
ncbi:MAG: arginine deiminase-related protein [Nitrospiraceae bacterium]